MARKKSGRKLIVRRVSGTFPLADVCFRSRGQVGDLSGCVILNPGDPRHDLVGESFESLQPLRPRSLEETFPWDHLEVGVKKAGLVREWERAGLAALLGA